MTGYKLIITEYSGKVLGDDVIYVHKETADYLFAKEKERVSKCHRPEETDDVKLEVVNYVKRSEVEGLVGRLIHQLDRRTRKDCVRETAFSKLTQEEINAIQDDR